MCLGQRLLGRLLSWLKETLLGRGNIGSDKLALLRVADDVEEVVKIIKEAHTGPVRPLTPPCAGVLFHCQDMARFFMCLLYC